jgi:hypothetical protein
MTERSRKERHNKSLRRLRELWRRKYDGEKEIYLHHALRPFCKTAKGDERKMKCRGHKMLATENFYENCKFEKFAFIVD